MEMKNHFETIFIKKRVYLNTFFILVSLYIIIFISALIFIESSNNKYLNSLVIHTDAVHELIMIKGFEDEDLKNHLNYIEEDLITKKFKNVNVGVEKSNDILNNTLYSIKINGSRPLTKIEKIFDIKNQNKINYEYKFVMK